jgi:hypothetical protein
MTMSNTPSTGFVEDGYILFLHKGTDGWDLWGSFDLAEGLAMEDTAMIAVQAHGVLKDRTEAEAVRDLVNLMWFKDAIEKFKLVKVRAEWEKVEVVRVDIIEDAPHNEASRDDVAAAEKQRDDAKEDLKGATERITALAAALLQAREHAKKLRATIDFLLTSGPFSA